ncbi:MAG: MBL fold metallo-hydrolase [Oscillospiraceae bacterium]|nr:MBL fold metallo-hydrolase [Oscillospiraceae bacterium]
MISQITVNEQSSVRIAGASVIYFDPFRIRNSAHDADFIFITHAHFDHFSPEDIRKVCKSGTTYIAPETMADELRKSGITDAVLLKPGVSVQVGEIPVETVPAYNQLKPFHPKKNGWLGYVITVGGQRIYVAGDTDATKDAKAVRCDIALIPVGGTYTTDAREAASLVNQIRPKTAIPIHYGTVVGGPEDGTVFAKHVDSGIQVVLKLGASI